MYAKNIRDIQIEMMFVKRKWNLSCLKSIWYVPKSGQNLFPPGTVSDKGLNEYADSK